MSELIKEWIKEEKTSFKGWGFSHLKNRKIDSKLPWDYISIVRKFTKKSKSVLDMGTGGGEIFASLAPFHGRATATEGYKPNYLLAKKRLGPLGVKVYFENSAVRKMQFKDNEFDLVLNRHDAFNTEEVFRVLQKKGIFLTQQVGSGNLKDLIEFFGSKSKYSIVFEKVKRELMKSGFEIKLAKKWKGKTEFKDVGAVVYFLKAIPWIVEGFSVDSYTEHLLKLQKKLESNKRIVFTETRFIIQAEKP